MIQGIILALLLCLLVFVVFVVVKEIIDSFKEDREDRKDGANTPPTAGVERKDRYYKDREGRTRCLRHGKLVYRSGAAAQSAVANARRRGTYLREYPEAECGWHLSSQQPRW